MSSTLILLKNSFLQQKRKNNKWRRLKLETVAKVVSGGTPSTKNPAYFGGKIAWLTPKDLSNYKAKYISRGERNITEEGEKES